MRTLQTIGILMFTAPLLVAHFMAFLDKYSEEKNASSNGWVAVFMLWVVPIVAIGYVFIAASLIAS